MRIIFAGTPDFAARHLQALLDANYDVVAVYTQPDRPAGRGKKLKPSEVKTLALTHDLPVCQPENFKDTSAQETLAKWDADIMVVVAYGIILPRIILDTPRLGCINVHGSLLPKWRGAAPIQRAIWAGDEETGVTIMQMDAGLDTGAMLHKHAIPIEPNDTSASLYDKLSVVGPTALVEALNNVANWKPEAQSDSQATYAKKLSKEEAKINWSLGATQLSRNVRAFNPWPVSWFELNNTAIKVWSLTVTSQSCEDYSPGEIIQAGRDGLLVATSDYAVKIEHIQIPGKKAAPFFDVYNARQAWFEPGTHL
ncbi:methionyl-tRNA formyltransferase [Alteromonas sediminis]|uniref:Methionyl-tRNA formyltransferase n=1 Tax=Alteromonas sediminis TaxID=2259342 RepID=A0A3N5XZN0_9ALTE|nr:methionyl-tRNA formyltransferase [Alteromonas sediminis]RPJ66797.1 methionyl-tRNA formyltransferase [Alteromonas sediminis]